MRLTDSARGSCVYFYFDRYRGDFNRSRHMFAIYESEGIRHWWCDVPEFVATPEELLERIAEHEASRHSEVQFLAAGQMDESQIDFTVLRLCEKDVEELIVIAFSADENARYLLYRYENARVLLKSQESGWGTVGEILGSRDLTIVQ